MAFIPVLIKDDLERFSALTQIDSFGASPVNRTFMAVAQEVMGLLRQAHSLQTSDINRIELTMIRAIEPEHRQSMMIEPLTVRELKVLQLIVDGYSNLVIAEKLYISKGTVKTHVRNILKKLYVSNRGQAAIRALRSGLVY